MDQDGPRATRRTAVAGILAPRPVEQQRALDGAACVALDAVDAREMDERAAVGRPAQLSTTTASVARPGATSGSRLTETLQASLSAAARMRSKDRAPSRWLEKWQAAGSTGQMPGTGVLRRSRTAAIAAAMAQPIAPKLMNRGDEARQRPSPTSGQRASATMPGQRPSSTESAARRDHRSAKYVVQDGSNAAHAYRCEKRRAWIDAKDNCLVMRCTARKTSYAQARGSCAQENPF